VSAAGGRASVTSRQALDAALAIPRGSDRPRLLSVLDSLPEAVLPLPQLSPFWVAVKRTTDILVALVGLFVLAPVLALMALAIKLDSRGPVFFRQVRMGSRDRTFRVFKFRTMEADADALKPTLAHMNRHALNGGGGLMFKVENDPRVTRVGRLLRRYFLDEVPQLLNVLKGEMSLVGPRPLILDEDRHVVAWARRRLDLKPGMTGLWQVLGHSAIPFEQMIKLDYIYVSTWSYANDWRLILRTIPLVLRGDGDRF
jgi:lipopolysaccharide/colanic/teichoic acid biosynthesis glycosyltransferase